MSATTHVTVTCPNCAKECGMSLRRVEVSVDTLNDGFGPKFVTRLTAEITAVGPHHCEVISE